jgi:uncharacterized membrane protein YhfC
MISGTKLFFMIISVIISIGLPILLAVLIVKRFKASVWPIIVGVIVFFVFQSILRIPLLNALSGTYWYQDLSDNTFLFSLFLGITAGIFEEVGRFIGYKVLIKRKNYSYKNGIGFGIGHGGFESVLLVGFTYINNIIMSIFINNGKFNTVFAASFSKDTLTLVKSQLIDTKAYMFLLGGIERIFAITIQIAFSLIILYAVKYKKYRYILLAILLHALVDTPVAYMSYNGIGTFYIEGYTLLCAIAALLYIMKSKKYFSDKISEETGE